MKSIKKNLRTLNNKGVAMVSVMIVATVCLLIATIVLEITYTSLLSRRVYTASNNTMYSAETAVDDMETVLQSIAVYSIKQNQSNPNESFVDIVESSLLAAAGTSSLTDTASIANYMYNNLDPYYKKMFSVDGTWDEATKTGVLDDTKFNVVVVKKQDGIATAGKGSLAIQVQFSYEDEKGFISDIKTDLVINDVTMRKSASNFALGSYSMFSGGGMKVVNPEGGNAINNNHKFYYKQEGNAYIGTMADDAPLALEVDIGTVIDFNGEFVEVNGDITLAEHSAVWFSGDGAQINVKGTIYIDKTAALVINEGVDLLCQDIVIVDGSSQWSIFSPGTSSYGNYNTGRVYTGFFPYNATQESKIKDNFNGVGYEDDFKNNRTGGCVILKKSDSQGYVLEYDSTSKKFKTLGTAVTLGDTKISYDKYYMAEAKTTAWTYDNQEIITDPEFDRVINVPLAYFQCKAGESALDYSNGYYIDPPGITRSIIRNTYPGLAGASPTGISSVNGLTASEIKASGGFKQFSNRESSTGYVLSAPFSLNGVSYNAVYFKVGMDGPGDVLHGQNSDIIMGCSWDKVRVQLAGGQFVGCVISGAYCQYEFNQADRYTCGYSILNAKDDMSDADALKIDQVMEELQYITFMRKDNPANQFSSLSCLYNTEQERYDYAYQYLSMDSLIVGGMKAFISDAGGSTAGSVTISDNSMYDFISVENWTQY